MDDLRTTLLTFAHDDRKEFLHFLQRQGRKQKGRLDTRLCELLLHPRAYPTPELLARLYPTEPNAVAYYALRKRLLRSLTDFLLLRQRQQDATAASSVRGLLILAQYLFETGVPRLAWNTLRKAEKLGLQNDQFEALNTVYNLQIAQAHHACADDLTDLIRRRNLNKKAADEEERANIVDSLMRQRLRQLRAKGRAGESFDAVLADTLREYDLQEAFARRPALLCRLVSIARSAMLVRRDFVSFAPFILRCYHLMEKRHGFAPAQRQYQLRLLYMIAHALYRSRRFEETTCYLTHMQALLAESPRTHYLEMRARYTLLLAATYAFLRRNHESIQLLEEALHDTRQPLPLANELTARLGLAFHYFAEGKFQKTNQVLISIGRSDHWCEQQMGLEWMLNKNLGEMLTLLELGHSELALNRLRAIERTVRERSPEAETGPYAYVLSYLVRVRDIIDNPAAATQPAFAEQVRQMPTFLPLVREDLQALSFYSWLHARMMGRPYYEVLLEVASAPPVGQTVH